MKTLSESLDQFGIPCIENSADTLNLASSSDAYAWAIKNVDGVDPQDNDEHTNQMFKDRVNDYCHQYRNVMTKSSVELYRTVMLSDISQLKTDDVGTHWSFKKEGAGSYGLNREKKPGEREHVLVGIAKPKDIDWEYGFTSFMWYGEEQWECALNPGSPVIITAVDDNKIDVPIKGKA